VAVRVKTKDDFPLDPDAPRLQTALRYAATGPEHRNDMQIFPSSFSTPLGGGPFAEEGIRFTCVMELAQSAGELRLNSNELVTQAETRAAETVRDAEERITRMLQQSEAEALSRKTEADAYALRSLRAMEVELGKLTGSVRKGIEVLAEQASSHMNTRRYAQEEEAAAGMLT